MQGRGALATRGRRGRTVKRYARGPQESLLQRILRFVTFTALAVGVVGGGLWASLRWSQPMVKERFECQVASSGRLPKIRRAHEKTFQTAEAQATTLGVGDEVRNDAADLAAIALDGCWTLRLSRGTIPFPKLASWYVTA